MVNIIDINFGEVEPEASDVSPQSAQDQTGEHTGDRWDLGEGADRLGGDAEEQSSRSHPLLGAAASNEVRAKAERRASDALMGVEWEAGEDGLGPGRRLRRPSRKNGGPPEGALTGTAGDEDSNGDADRDEDDSDEDFSDEEAGFGVHQPWSRDAVPQSSVIDRLHVDVDPSTTHAFLKRQDPKESLGNNHGLEMYFAVVSPKQPDYRPPLPPPNYS